jgi:photosystem II stability/assembly factor-like uncharacterized protein
MLFKFTKIVFTLLFVSGSHNLYSQTFWNEVNSGVTAALRCVSNIDATVAWSCGASGTVIRTTDGGYNWENLTGIPSNVTLINIFGIDQDHALTAGYSGTSTNVYYTETGGVLWNLVFTQANGFIDGIWMKSSQQGIMVGDPVGGRWSLWKTNNGGVNWDSTGLFLPQSGTEAGWNSSIWADSNQIWFGTNNNRIYYSSNHGANWVVQSTGSEQNSYMVTFRLPDRQYGLAGGNTLLLTSNGGQNWENVTTTGTGIFNGAAITSAYMSIGWYIRSSNTIYRSWFPFNNWIADYTAPSGTYNHMSLARTFFSYGPGMIFAVRSNGGISRGNFIVEGVKILSNEIPASFKLYQNYPNPFNPSTKIKLEIPLLKNNAAGEIRGSLILIKIYNSLGQEIETVLNQITRPGVYEESWNGSKYPSGVYYYQVVIIDPQSSNSAIEHKGTMKMVLIK